MQYAHAETHPQVVASFEACFAILLQNVILKSLLETGRELS